MISKVVPKSDIWKVFHKYDSVHGIHRKLKTYIQDNGRWKLTYFVAHLSHEIYKARGICGHAARQKIRDDLIQLADKMYNQVLREGRVSQ